MLTAYGAQDFHAEILLGYGMQILHEVPVLSREAIRLSLAPPSPVVGGGGLPPALEALATSELAEQVEQIKITPQVMTTEEMYRIWTAFQAHYRPTAAYLVSVVLIESMRPVRSPLPVLTQGMLDRGPQVQPNLIPPLPALIEVLPPNRQPGLRLGETLRLRGRTLEGANPVASFSHAQFDEPIERPLTLISASEAEVVLPNAPSIWPAGIYTVTVAVQQAGETVPRITNRLPFALVPTINSISASRDAEERVNFSVSCTPAVFPNQRVSLTVGDQEILVSAPTSASGSLTVTAVGLAAGTYRVRLRVDGIDSLLVNYATTPPSFDPTQEVTVP
jgi:Pvc16 N-terminal domain